MVRAAIVGLGRWGQVLVRSIHGKSDRLRIARAVTRTPSKAVDFCSDAGIPLDDDYAGLLSDSDIDAVILATPHSQHADQIVAAARAGKHVFVEKPLALSSAEAARAVAACEQAGVVLAVGQNRRFLPAFGKMRTLIESGSLGKCLHVEGTFSGPSGYRHQPDVWRASTQESPGGGMTGKGLHVTDLMVALFGEIDAVDARSLRQVLDIGMDDTTFTLLRFGSGMTGYLSTLTATADVWRLRVFGSRGWAEMQGQNRLVVSQIGHAENVEDFAPVDIERAALEAFADAIRGAALFPVLGTEAVHNIALLEAIVRSSAMESTVAV